MPEARGGDIRSKLSREGTRLLVRFERGIESVTIPQIQFVEKHTIHAYDSLVSSLPQSDLKKTAKNIRPTIARVAKGAGVALVVAEGVALTIGAIKGADWLIKKVKKPKTSILYTSEPVGDGTVLALQERIPRVRRFVAPETKISPEVEAYAVLMREISTLKETGKASDTLQRFMFMVANNEGMTVHGKVSFKHAAVETLEHLVGNGAEDLIEARRAYQQMGHGDMEMKLEDVLEHMLYGARKLPDMDGISLNWWNWAYRGVGLRELLGVPPEQVIHGLDYGPQWSKKPIPYLEYVKNIIDRCQPSSSDWAFNA